MCSPLRRARETCRLAGLDAGAEIVDDLREWDYGEYEGLTRAQIHARRPEWFLWRDGCPGGESPAQVVARADRVLARARGSGGQIVAFAHGHILRVVAARWIGAGPEIGARLLLDAGSVSGLGFEHDLEVLARWNN